MKFIGQFIQNFIARFRNDVYLEDISSGTIASGGNLGLDSNNKIVKATIASGSGDITAVTITTDSGGGSAASDTGGSADFSLLGAAGVDVTNSGTTITARAVPAEIDHDSLQNFDANEHFTQANITTVGTIGTGVWNGTKIDAIYTSSSGRRFGSTIKLIPSDFSANDDGGNTKFGVGYVDHAGTGYGMRPANSNTELFAFVSIPEGMKATHVHIYAKGTYAIEVFDVQIDATTMTSKGTGNCNTNLDITDVNASATNFLAVSIATTSTSDRVYGGIVTIANQ